MESLLPARFKNLIPGLFIAILAGFFLLIGLSTGGSFSEKEIQALVKKEAERLNGQLGLEINRALIRSDSVGEKFAARRLNHSDLRPGEALLIEKEGRISDYYGEIDFFRMESVGLKEWRLIKKAQELFFFRRLDSNLYYISHFINLEKNSLLDQLRPSFPITELLSYPASSTAVIDEFYFEPMKKCYFFYQGLSRSQNQMAVKFIFPEGYLNDFYQKKRNTILNLIGLALMLGLLAAGRRKRNHFWRMIRILVLSAGFAILWWILPNWIKKDLVCKIGPVEAFSIFQILIALIFIMGVLQVFRRVIGSGHPWLTWLLFNAFALLVMLIIPIVLRGIQFGVSEFRLSWDYLTLLIVLILFHLLPFKAAEICRFTAIRFPLFLLALLQLVVLFLYWRWGGPNPLNCFLLTFIFFLLLFWDRVFLSRILLAAAIALSIGILTNRYSAEEKRDFISHNLQLIFSSQNTYAKLVAREIVYEINPMEKQFLQFFSDNGGAELERFWKNSLASRENIPSGIFVVSDQGKLLDSFSYQMPYIELKNKDIFPFWHIEETSAELFGRKVNLAVATIGIFGKDKYLGFIMVQVLNSPELIIKDLQQTTIFTLNAKIKGTPLGYLKLGEQNEVLENPANMTLENLDEILQNNEAWVRFNWMNVTYNGYIFKDGDQKIVIFYPRPSFVKTISDFIKMFALTLLILALLNLKKLVNIDFRSFYYSFSIKVFAILILIAIFIAVVFSLFSLNYHAVSSERELIRSIYEKGRTVRNIVENLIAEAGELNQNHLFLLSSLLGNEVSVYEKGELLLTSNYRKIIQSQIPIYLHSRIRDILTKKNQPFELLRRGDKLQLYFRIYPETIVNVEFASPADDLAGGRQSYTDFIVTLFFVLILVGTFSALFFRNKIVAPIHTLNAGMAEVEAGHLAQLKKIPAELELKSLFTGFNSMVEGIRTQKKNVSEIARMKTLVQLGRRIAHEIKNPLTPIRLSSEQILHSLNDRQVDDVQTIRRAVAFIIEETEHLKRVALGFLDLSKLDELKVEEFVLNPLLEEEIEKYRSIYPHIGFRITASDPRIQVKADRLKLKQLMQNLLNNSVEAITQKSGRIEVELQTDREWVGIQISDTGSGIGADDLEQIFNAEFTTKETGTGLGLVIAKRIVELHGGQIGVVSQKESGTRVNLRFRIDVTKT